MESITFSPDGQILASGSEDNTIKLWSLEYGRGVRREEPSEPEIGIKRMVKVYLKPAKCECEGEHGNIFVVYSDGTTKQLKQDGRGYQPKLAPDGKTVGWLEGFHLEADAPLAEEFLTGDLVLYRDGRILRKIETGLNASWDFREGGKQVALTGSPTLRFSPFEYTLYDVDTGRLIAKWSDEREEKGEKNLRGLRVCRFKDRHCHPMGMKRGWLLCQK